MIVYELNHKDEIVTVSSNECDIKDSFDSRSMAKIEQTKRRLFYCKNSKRKSQLEKRLEYYKKIFPEEFI